MGKPINSSTKVKNTMMTMVDVVITERINEEKPEEDKCPVCTMFGVDWIIIDISNLSDTTPFFNSLNTSKATFYSCGCIQFRQY